MRSNWIAIETEHYSVRVLHRNNIFYVFLRSLGQTSHSAEKQTNKLHFHLFASRFTLMAIKQISTIEVNNKLQLDVEYNDSNFIWDLINLYQITLSIKIISQVAIVSIL